MSDIDREVRSWLILAALVATGWFVYLLAPVITPFAVAAGLAYLGDPLTDRLEHAGIGRWRLGRTLAVIIVFLLIVLVLALLLLVLVPLLIDELRHLLENLPRYLEWLSGTALPWLLTAVGMEPDVLDTRQLIDTAKSYWREISTAAFEVLGSLGKGGQVVLQWIANLVLVPVVTFYLLRDWDALVGGVRRLLPRRAEPRVVTIVGEIDEVLGAFIRGQLIVMLALGLIYSLGLWLVGINLAFLIGMGAGLLSIVPYLGSIIGLLGAAGVALFQYQDLMHVLLVLGVFGVGQALEGMVLTPMLVGDRIGLHPVAVIFAVLVGGQLFGFLGILLALPAAAALNVLVRHASVEYRGSELYASEPRRAASQEAVDD